MLTEMIVWDETSFLGVMSGEPFRSSAPVSSFLWVWEFLGRINMMPAMNAKQKSSSSRI
jgi:hypothetical protein